MKIIYILLVVLTGCENNISADHLKKALDVCSKNDGTESVDIDSSNVEQIVITRAICKDGMIKEFSI